MMPGCRVDSKATGSTGHQPVRSATPARAAMAPAFCGGITLATAALWRAKSVTKVRVEGFDPDRSAAPAQTPGAAIR